MTDVLSMLEAEHRQVEDVLGRLGSSEPGEERERLAAELEHALDVHMAFEEEQLYPVLRQVDQGMDDEAEAEHHLARDSLATMVSMTAAPGFGAVVDMVKGAIAHHVRDEEHGAFPKLRRSLDRDALERLGVELEHRRADAGIVVEEDEMPELADDEVRGRSAVVVGELEAMLHDRTS